MTLGAIQRQHSYCFIFPNLFSGFLRTVHRIQLLEQVVWLSAGPTVFRHSAVIGAGTGVALGAAHTTLSGYR